MGNLTDYVRARGRQGFDEAPFNDLDSIVLCEMSYIDFARVYPAPRPGAPNDDDAIPTVRALIDALRRAKDLRLLTLDGGASRTSTSFIKAVAASRRFGTLHLDAFAQITDRTRQTQFSACLFRIAPSLHFLAYRGTDDSIIGWKEDFAISFTHTPAQTIGCEWAHEQIAHYGGDFIVGGHSKGGNLALYTALNLDDGDFGHLRHVYVLDGPGLCDEVFEATQRRPMASINGMTTRFIPTFCVIGGLFEPRITDTRIFASSATGTYQHDLLSWKFNGAHPHYKNARNPMSLWINMTLATWLDGVSVKERREFTDNLFDALQANGATSMSGIADGNGSGLQNILAVLAQLTPDTIDTALSLPQSAVRTTKDTLAGLGSEAQSQFATWIADVKKKAGRERTTDGPDSAGTAETAHNDGDGGSDGAGDA